MFIFDGISSQFAVRSRILLYCVSIQSSYVPFEFSGPQYRVDIKVDGIGAATHHSDPQDLTKVFLLEGRDILEIWGIQASLFI